MLEEKEIGVYLLAGLFAGFGIVLVNGAIYFIVGNDAVYYATSGLLNPFALMYGSMLPPVVAGILLYYLDRLRGGRWLYLLILAVLSVWLIWSVSSNAFADYAPYSHEVKRIMLMMLVVCCAGNLLLPFVAGSKKIMAKVI